MIIIGVRCSIVSWIGILVHDAVLSIRLRYQWEVVQ